MKESIIKVSARNCNNKIRLMSVFMVSIVIIYGSFAFADARSVLKQEFNKTFYKMLDDPSNVDVTMHYANLAIELGDYEAAIPALERILLFNPDLPRIKQEIGVLYYRLDAFDMAKSYLEDARSGDNVPQDVLDTANMYLRKMK